MNETGVVAGQELSFLNSEPQHVSTPVEQKRGRGRPPKKSRFRLVKPEKVEKEYSMAMETCFEDSGMVENNLTAPPIVLKLKLGVKNESNDEGMILNQTEPLMKRGRGRPKKIKTSPQEKTFIDEEYSHDNPITMESGWCRPRKPLFLPDNDLEDNSQPHIKQISNISEVKTRLRGRPKTNYLHVQRMWTPKTEGFRKHRNKNKVNDETPVVKGVRGRPRIHPLPDPNVVKIRGRPRVESYDPEHIKLLLEKKYPKEVKKTPSGFRGRPTKLESIKLMLEDRRQLHAATDSQTSTKCTTPNQDDSDGGDSELIDVEDGCQLTFPLAKMVEEIHGSKAGESIENKENLLFVSSKALCDNRKLKEKLLERNDPVFRDMKLKFKQELKNIQREEVKAKQQPPVKTINYPAKRRRGPRGPYKKTLMKFAAASESITPPRTPISQRLIAKREAAALAAAAKALEPPPEPMKPAVRKKIVPTYREQQQKQQYVPPACTIELVSKSKSVSNNISNNVSNNLSNLKKVSTNNVSKKNSNSNMPKEPEPLYPSDLDRFMRANNLTYNRDPVPNIRMISKDPFAMKPAHTLIVSKNPFLNPGPPRSAQNNMNVMSKKVNKKPRGRPRKYHPITMTPNEHKSNGSTSVCINLISSDEEEEEEDNYNPFNYTYPTVTNEPVNYDEESYDDRAFALFHDNDDNNISISLISDDED